MSTFLSKLVDECISHKLIHPDTIIVLPNQRAKKMLVSELYQRKDIPKPSFLPEILSIEHFLEMLSPLRRGKPLELLTVLYESYAPMVEKEDKLSDFLRWADTFIKDISDLEMHRQNVAEILKDVAGIKDFEIRLGHDSISSGQEETIQFYQRLIQLYQVFNQNLYQKGLAYPGFLYRDCAEHIDQYSNVLSGKKLVFAGLYVLSPSEQDIVKYLKDNFETRFYFDFDPFYCDFEKEAMFSTSHFLREVCDKLTFDKDALHFKETCYETEPKKIKIIGAPGRESQILYTVQRLHDMQSKNPEVLNDTVVVLADESMLLPFLKAYGTENVNVTKGVPFKMTQTYRLISDLLDLYQFGFEQVKDEEEKPIPLYHNVLEKVLGCNLLYCLKPEEEDEDSWSKILELLRSGSVYLSVNDLLKPYLPAFTNRQEKMLSQLTDYLDRLVSEVSSKNAAYYQLKNALVAIRDIEPLLKITSEKDVTFAVVKNLIMQQLDTLSLSLKGDPQQGLQVMGLLETRALDFQNVIMLGVNEGIIPRPVKYNSLLPFDIVYRGSTISNYIYKDKITAYHFFRLLQRAAQVELLFNTSSKDGIAEQSRFITQLEFEVKEQGLDNIQIERQALIFKLDQKEQQLQVDKTDEIIEKLKAYEFSPSSLTTYIRCPFRFYLKDICHVSEDEDDDLLQSNTIGTLVHRILQAVFENMKKSGNYMEFLNSLKVDEVDEDYIIPAVIKEAKIDKSELNTGRFMLLHEIVRKHVVGYLGRAKEEFMDGDVTLLSFEPKVLCDYTYQEGEETKTVKLKGYIDRLQKKGSHLMILDYKTGSMNADYVTTDEDQVEKIFTEAGHDKLLQLFVYAELCKHTKDEMIKAEREKGIFDPICGIISTKESMKMDKNATCLFTLDYNGQSYFDEKILAVFEEHFNVLLTKIFDKGIPFYQTENHDNCGYCDFKTICHR
ncbi:MAG: exodeoxyribonuclease V subunit gamma [Bacteroidales bacterium]|nr:exodeoxyribonuclease V subunit gamma [Bacteroidales bacterium]MBO7646802.1 exodeoxyribonuclease V subunit gamma [Bacteroidales bacterium]